MEKSKNQYTHVFAKDYWGYDQFEDEYFVNIPESASDVTLKATNRGLWYEYKDKEGNLCKVGVGEFDE